ncbi:MAG: 2-oxo acid dehydrogenase subunit E2 [Chloroflexi bacterium]|nr:2-oxo acid dehydrogenase subunit E2 [Chloroflexota bacterium]
MATNIIMPKLGFDMSSGKVVRWLKTEGAAVRRGEAVLEIETDKATVEVQAEVDGILGSIIVAEGDVPVGNAIGQILAAGESMGAAAPAAAPIAKATVTAAPGKSAESTPRPTIAAPSGTALNAGGRIVASPIARRLAQEMSVDLTRIKGTGPGGRIVRDDVKAQKASQPAAQALAAIPSAAPAAGDLLLTRMRQTIARRMAESKGPIPQFYITSEVDMGAAMAVVNQMLEAGKAEDLRVSPLTLVMKACGLMLRKYPALNASFGGDRLIMHERVNIGVAVAIEGGLLTPVVPDCDQKSVAQIARDTRAAAERARSGKLNTDDMSQGTFSISNLGMFDVEHFVAIVNPPEAAILALGTAKEAPVVENGQLKTGWRMKMTLSADHRITDGAEAARFLQEVKKLLQTPMALFL